MVLNREENRDSIQFSNESAGYLVCSGCDGFYELQEDETPEDFDNCECGSPLVYYKTREELENRLESSSDLKSTKSDESSVEEPAEKAPTEKLSPEKTSVKETSLEKFSARESVFEEEISKNNNSEKVKEVKEPLNIETGSNSGEKTTDYANKSAVSANKSAVYTNRSAVDRLSPQTTVSDDVLTNRRQDGKDLWGNLDDLNSKNNHQSPQASGDPSIEMDRLMVMVDHKRTFKEKEKQFTVESGQGKSPIMIIGVVIVLVVVVLALTMVLGIF
jgi:cobalamin biosynthesis Mg chelatase CobN